MSTKSFGMSFEWGPTKPCDDTQSPPLEIFNSPPGTKYIQIALFNNSTGEARGKALAQALGQTSFGYGAFKSIDYKGPCSPPASVYRLKVTALNGSGETHAIATGTLRFPPDP